MNKKMYFLIVSGFIVMLAPIAVALHFGFKEGMIQNFGIILVIMGVALTD